MHLNQLSLKRSLFYSAVLICALLVGGNIIVWRSSSALSLAANEAAQAEQSVRLFKDTRYHVVQIQQFLTDAAAVGEASLGEAGEQRTQALHHIARLTALLPERQASLRQLDDAVRRLYEIGERMVQAYVGQGREAGNAIMKGDGGFDASAASAAAVLAGLSGELETLAENTRARADAARQRMLYTSVGVAVGTLFASSCPISGWGRCCSASSAANRLVPPKRSRDWLPAT